MFFDKFYLRGDQNLYVPAHLNFGKYVLDNLQKHEDDVALINSETGERITTKEFAQYSVKLAVGLLELGIGKGDVVALGSEKRITFLPTALSIVLTGATCTFIDMHDGKSILRHKLMLSKPKYVICSKLFFEKYTDILQCFDCIKTYLSLDDRKLSNIITVQSLIAKDVDVRNFEPAPVNGQIDTAIIIYSSGTTGSSKGICRTHMNCIISSLSDNFCDKNIKTAYIYGDWYHYYCQFMTYKFLSAGKIVVYIDNVTIPKLLNCIEKYQVDIAMVVPYLLNMLNKEENLSSYNLESLRIIESRASPLHSKTIEKIKARFPKVENVLQGYGMTECGELTSETWGVKGPKPGSVGMASPGRTLKVVDIETEEKLGPNKAGEIRVLGPGLMKGYIGVDSQHHLDKEGFLKTGDMGYYDEDNYLFLVDRIKEVIDHKGEKVSPTEVETILEQHPDIVEAAVIGEPHPEYGELPMAFVVKTSTSSIKEEDLVEYMRAEVPSFMQLHGGVKFIQKIPRSSIGKILRWQLRDKLNNPF